jgi:hypothetical protein
MYITETGIADAKDDRRSKMIESYYKAVSDDFPVVSVHISMFHICPHLIFLSSTLVCLSFFQVTNPHLVLLQLQFCYMHRSCKPLLMGTMSEVSTTGEPYDIN